MIKEYFGCLISSLVILVLGVILIMVIFDFSLPIECGHRVLQHISSSTVGQSKKDNAFMWEYKTDSISYKGNEIKVSSAFVEHSHYCENDSLIIEQDACDLFVSFNILQPSESQSYAHTWLINDMFNLKSSNHVTWQYHDGLVPPDTLTFYVRECHPSLDSLSIKSYSKVIETLFDWDTITSITLIRVK